MWLLWERGLLCFNFEVSKRSMGGSSDILRNKKVKVMKNIILIATVFASTFGQLWSSNPVIEDKCCEVVVSSTQVDFAYDVDVYSQYFTPAYFNEATNSLNFESYQDIKFIAIHDATGELKYKLPVMSNKVRINKNMFDKGDYKVSFEITDMDDALITYVTIN